MRLTIPKFRTWHLMGIIAASAAFFSVFQYRWSVEDRGYALIRQLRSLDAENRVKAANELTTLSRVERRSVPRLTEMLFDPDARVRAAAAEALRQIVGEINRNAGEEAVVEPVQAALASALGDRDPAARVAIVRALGSLGATPKLIVPRLLELAGGRDPQIQSQALVVLGQYLRVSEPAVAAVLAGLKNADPVVRQASVQALGEGGAFPSAALEPLQGRIKTALVGMSDDPDSRVRLLVVVALNWIAHQTSSEDPHLIRFLNDPDRQVRQTAFTSVEWGSPRRRSPEFVPALEPLLAHPEAKVRESAAFALGRRGIDAESTLPALKRLTGDPEAVVKSAASKAVEAIEQDVEGFRSKTLPGLIAELGDDNWGSRILAAERIEEFGPKASASIPALVRSLDDPEAEVRRASARALGRLGPEAAVAAPTLAKLAVDDADERVRQAAKTARSILLGENPPG